METDQVRNHASEPIPSQPVPERGIPRVRWVGVLRIPLGGPYRPLAHLYEGPDGTLWWTVRLWEIDRACPRVVSTGALVAFARANRLPGLERAVASLVERARHGGRS